MMPPSRKGLQALGVPPSASWNYINSTCVEITPVGASKCMGSFPLLQFMWLLLEEISEQAINLRPTLWISKTATGKD